MNKNYETELPDGYTEAYVIDAVNAKTALHINIASLIVAAVLIIVSALIIKPHDFFGEYSLARNFILIAAVFVYIVLHELAHGAAYKIQTRCKLRFGFNLSVAYCGTPDIYVYRRCALIALLTPFVMFIPVFLIPAFVFSNAWDRFYAMLLFSLHVSGCIGDLFDTFLYLFRFTSPDVLMRDTGPKQTFYTKS